MPRFDHNSLKNNAPTAHLFYTGFTWEEIEQIAAAFKRTLAKKNDITVRDDDEYFDYPSYGGLPRAISKRLTSDQVDYINQEGPTTVKGVAQTLARGK